MKRIKKCRYCQKEFTAKRIDAKYCSDSCRQMGYRRDSNPATYGKVVPVYFELDDYEYSDVLQKAEELEMHPNEYVKNIVTKKDNTLNINFSEEDWSGIIVFLIDKYEVSAEKLVKDLFLKAAEEDLCNS